MCTEVAGADGVDGTQRIGTTGHRCLGDVRDVIDVGRELRHDRNIYCRFHRGSDLLHQIWILTHCHAIAIRVRAGQVQFQAVAVRREDSCDLDEFFNAPTKYRCQQEPIWWNFQFSEKFCRTLRSRVGQSYGVHEAARRVLAQYGFAVAQARRKPNALGRHHTNLGDVTKQIFDDWHRCSHDPGRDGKRATQRFAQKLSSQI